MDNFETFQRNNASLNHREFNEISRLIFEHTGIHLNDNKKPMIQARLGKRLRVLGLSSYKEYVKYLEDSPAAEFTNFVNALTTNKTEFFREKNHFNYLKNVCLKKFFNAEHPRKPFYAWSAASSTGVEAYTLAMVFEEFARIHPGFDYRILGSDIDTNVLDTATEGVYNLETVKVIPPDYIQRYFMKGNDRNLRMFKVKPFIKDKVKFRSHNLIDPTSNFPISFDVIFIRNVLIYFKKETTEKVIFKMHRHLKPGGLLFIGNSETLTGIRHKFKHIESTIYMKL